MTEAYSGLLQSNRFFLTISSCSSLYNLLQNITYHKIAIVAYNISFKDLLNYGLFIDIKTLSNRLIPKLFIYFKV